MQSQQSNKAHKSMMALFIDEENMYSQTLPKKIQKQQEQTGRNVFGWFCFM